MLLTTPIAFARVQAQTDVNGLTDSNAIIFANEALEDWHRKLVKAGVDASQLQESYRAGTVGQGTYLYPTDMFFLKAIQLNYANTTADQYKTALQVDVSNLAEGSFGWLRTNASTTSPQFDDRGDWFEIFPTPVAANNVTQLIRIIYYLQPTLFSAVGDTVAYPEDLDQAILGFRIAANYKRSLLDFTAAAVFDASEGDCQEFCARGHDDGKERIITWRSRRNFWTGCLRAAIRMSCLPGTGCSTS